MSTFFLKLQSSEIFEYEIFPLLFVPCMFPLKIKRFFVVYSTISRGPLQPVRNQTFWFSKGEAGCHSAQHLLFLKGRKGITVPTCHLEPTSHALDDVNGT